MLIERPRVISYASSKFYPIYHLLQDIHRLNVHDFERDL